MNPSGFENRSISTGKREKARRRIVTLTLIFYFLLIMEGALRKWFFPQYNKYLFFIKDPFVLYAYYLAFKYKLWPQRQKITKYAYFLCGFGLLYICIQYISQYPHNTVLSLIYGWRMFFFYVPLAFLIGNTFKAADLKRFIGLTLLIAIPMGAIAYKQVTSPPTAFINRVGGAGEGYVTISGFTGKGERWTGIHGKVHVKRVSGGTLVRTTGTFSYFHGWQIFLGSMIASVFIAWILPVSDRPLKNRSVLILSTIATGVAFASDVTRFPTFLAIFITLTAVYSLRHVQDPVIKSRLRKVLVVLIWMGVFISVRYFANLKAARESRMDEDYLQGRTTRMFTDFIQDLKGYPKFGGGLGAGNPGGRALGSTQDFRWDPPLDWYSYRRWEDEWSCMFSEAGIILGFMYLYFRFWIVFWLFKNAVTAVKRSDNPAPLIMFGFISSVILVWYITKIGTVNSLGWLYCGICIALNRLGDKGMWSDMIGPEVGQEVKEIASE